MSYTIFYRNLFVKTRDNKYIPIVESGDNNCYEIDSNRRERSWESVRLTEEPKLSLTANEIMAGVERWVDNAKEYYIGRPIDVFDKTSRPITERDVEEGFGNYDGLAIGNANWSKTSAQTVRNFFKRGIKQAVDFKDVDLVVWWYAYTEGRKDVKTERRYPKTEDELLEVFEEAKRKGYSPYVTFLSAWSWDHIFEQRKQERMRNRVHKTKGYVVTIEGYYFTRMSSRQFHYGYGLGWAHVYATRKAAENMQQRIIRNHYTSEIIEVKRDGEEWKKVA